MFKLQVFCSFLLKSMQSKTGLYDQTVRFWNIIVTCQAELVRLEKQCFLLLFLTSFPLWHASLLAQLNLQIWHFKFNKKKKKIDVEVTYYCYLHHWLVEWWHVLFCSTCQRQVIEEYMGHSGGDVRSRAVWLRCRLHRRAHQGLPVWCVFASGQGKRSALPRSTHRCVMQTACTST